MPIVEAAEGFVEQGAAPDRPITITPHFLLCLARGLERMDPMLQTKILIPILLILPGAAAAQEVTSAADRHVAAACATASGLIEARVGPPIRFANGADARLVSGRRPQARAQDRPATMLCLFDRASRQAEVRDTAGWGALEAPLPDIVGLNWRLVMIDSAPPSSTRPVTLTLGADGQVNGSSGCNLYSGRYSVDRSNFRIVGPLTGTRRACEPSAMNLELQYKQALQRARTWSIGPGGALIVRLAGGGSLRFRRM